MQQAATNGGDYAFTDKNGGKHIPSVQWSENYATVLPLNAKIYHHKDAKGNLVLDMTDYNDADIIAVVALRGNAYRDKLAKQAQEAKQKTQQYSTKEADTSSREVPMSERPPGTEDWIWTRKVPKQNNNYSDPATRGFVQGIGGFDYYFLNNGQRGFGQRIGNFYYYNGW